MLNEKVIGALNEQVNHEFYAAYLYLAMSAYFESIDMKGFAKWMRAQAKEEVKHAMKIFDYLPEIGACVHLQEIKKPILEWKSPLAAFEAAYKHEVKVTGLIHKLVETAEKAKDYATVSFLQWYINEQVEEEASALENVKKVKMLEGNPATLYLLDKELGARGD